MLLTTLDKRNEETIRQLVSLWNTVFGDGEDYIRLIVPYLEAFDCYAVKDADRIVSAFYLLPSEIKIGNSIFKGKYLYAAATYEEYRKNGYMSSLIREAINDNKNTSDFISLVPADDGLYSYYGRFGFEELMFNCKTKLICDGKKETDGKVIISAEKINSLRKKAFDCVHLFEDSTMNYALSCYGFFGSHFKEVDDYTVLYVEDERSVYEGIICKNTKCDYESFLKEKYCGEIKAITPYRMNETTEKIKCGMIYDFSGEIKNSGGIYMNHTLM